jgi:hypothetical protein
MSADLVEALEAVARRLLALAGQDAGLRAHLRSLAEAVLEATAEAPPQPIVEPGQEPLPAASAPAVSSSPAPAPAAPEIPVPASSEVFLPLLDAARAAPAEEPAAGAEARPRRWPATPASEINLAYIEARSRLKAKAARWAIERKQRSDRKDDFWTEIDPIDRDLIAQAKALPDCYLWMNTPEWIIPDDRSLVARVAGCFDAVADAVALLQAYQADGENNLDLFRRILDLTAESQSALRVALLEQEGGRNDLDQSQVFTWLKATASEKQVFIKRYMRADDPASPGRWPELRLRIEEVRKQMDELRQRGKRRKKLLGNLRWKVQRITAGDVERGESWQTIMTTVDELVQAGVPASNVDVRELLLPILDDMPEQANAPRGFQLVLREIDRYLASRPAPPETLALDEPTAEVKEAARLLSGKSVVLIGGERRPDAVEALKSAFGLRELYWMEGKEHQSLLGFEPYVARPDVAVVILAIRWSSHSFGDVKNFCDTYGKPLVRLPSGYHPNQVAHQVLSQCSERLMEARAPSRPA